MKSRIITSLAVLTAFLLGLVMVRPIAQAVEILAVTSCNIAGGACIGGKNSNNGPGVVGQSQNGYGLSGQTKFPSTSGTKFSAGSFGVDRSASGKFDAGVYGQSTRGDGVLGTSSSSAGVYGASSSSTGVIGTSTKTTGVYGQVTGGKGSPTGVYGQDQSTNVNGAGVAGQSQVGTGVVASTNSTSTNLQALVAAAPNGAFVFTGVGGNNQEVATIDGSGNMQIAGSIFTSNQCQSGCGRRREQSYASTAASPTIEDTGEAQLAGGAAIVRLDAAFANVIDPRQGYYVLITPEGDTRGLYVARRTPGGFEVRESAGGRSSVPFAYRIVAHPFGVHPNRLPLIETRTIPTLRTDQATIQTQRVPEQQ
jgi:hypothetical protein